MTAPAGEQLVARRAAAVSSWSLLLTSRQAEGLRKWVLYGDLTDVDDVHRGLVDEWEAADAHRRAADALDPRDPADCCERVLPGLTAGDRGLLFCQSCGETLEAVWQEDDGQLRSSTAGAGAFELVPAPVVDADGILERLEQRLGIAS